MVVDDVSHVHGHEEAAVVMEAPFGALRRLASRGAPLDEAREGAPLIWALLTSLAGVHA